MFESARMDPFAATLLEDPYPLYERLRREDPVHWSLRNAWLVTRHADVASLLTDERLHHWMLPERAGGSQEDLSRVLGRWLELMKPQHRSRLRRLTQQVFSPGAIKALAGRLEAHAESLLDQFPEDGAVDLVHAYALPFSLGGIGELFGVPFHRRELFERLASTIAGQLVPVLLLGRASASFSQSTQPFFQFLLACLAEKERNPGEDLMSALFLAQEGGDPLEREDFLALCIVFLFAGYENAKNFISGSVLTLLRHPDQLAYLGEDPSRMPHAIEELLRYESPVQTISLTAHMELPVGTRTIQAGQQVLLSVAAANRDPAVFTEPDRLDLSRRDNPHLAFGHGPYFCLGAPLARLEASVALQVLFRRFPRLQLTGATLSWGGGPPVLRGLRQLPVMGCGRA
jgi:cytochrome P450